jgi:lipopolysaccharide export system protein LptA
MRRSRWLILAALVCIVAFVGRTYLIRKATLAQDAPSPPPPLDKGIDGRANDWVYTQSDGEHPRVTVRAKSFRQVKSPSLMELEDVELRLFQKDATQFDLVKCASAQFDIAAKTLYSDGEVEISMGIPSDGEPRGRILKIHGSGVRFASDTGRASTDREARFEFDQGGGSAVGVDYDPQIRELHLRSNVSLDWRGSNPRAKLMHIEAGEAIYREGEQRVVLLPWSRFTRDTLRIEGGASEVKLDHGAIQQTVSVNARGIQNDQNRVVEFAADQLMIEFGGDTAVKHIKGGGNGRLISTANGMRTTVTGDAIDLDFELAGASKESVLKHAVARGKSVAEARPLERPGELMPDTRVLRSDIIHLAMRPGGREIEKVETEGPGTVDFLPTRKGQPKRWMKGDRIWITYGPDNRIERFESINVQTRTERPEQPAAPPMLTQSKEIAANFDPQTSELTTLIQRTGFRYQEGTRQATSNVATLDQKNDIITLEGAARVWDPTGSATADRIVMNQKSGDYTADGRVATTRQPDQKGSSSAMLSSDEVMQGRAQRFTSAEHNQKLHYEGNAVVWQGANRVEAERIDIDRQQQTFQARGNVVSQFVDKSRDKPNDKGGRTSSAKASPPVFTVVRAPEMIYMDQTRIAHYKGGAAMTRPGLTVTGRELRAYLNQKDADDSLDKAFADGGVKIVSTENKRTRTGTSDHAEYYTADQKVILDGGDPLLVDSLKGQTRGKQLTWWANDDRLLVNGMENRPADSLIRKK